MDLIFVCDVSDISQSLIGSQLKVLHPKLSAHSDFRQVMKKKVVRLGKLNRLYVHTKKPDQGVGPCALELSAVLNCWSNTRATPDANECKALVESLTNCMRTYVASLLFFSSFTDCQRKSPTQRSTVNFHLYA